MNALVLVADMFAEVNYRISDYSGETSEPLLCRLKDGLVLNTGLTMAIIHGDTLMKRVPEIIEVLVERIQYNYWISL